MKVKKFLLLSFLIFIFIFPSVGEKKQKPLPLAELQNPKGPSYVPIPYPQTREEIITDLKYAIKRLYVPKKSLKSYGDFGSSKRLLPKLLEEKTELYVGEIVTASNRTFLRSDNYFIMDIHNLSGVVVARVALEDSGLFAGARFASEAFKMNPLISSTSEAKDFFAKNRISTLANEEIESIEYELFSGGSATIPVLKIKSTSGIFYMDARDAIFKFQRKKQFSSEKEIRDYGLKLFEKYDIHHIKKPFDRTMVNSLTNEVIFIKKVN